MSRHSTDHSSTVDDSAWLSARIAPQQTAIFYHGTEGNDRLFGSNFDDYFDLSQGGDDRAIGRGGDDVFYFGAAFTGADRVDGGTSANGTLGDMVILDGDYSAGITVERHSLTNVELLGLNGGSFTIDGYLGVGTKFQTLVDATSLTKNQSLNLAVSSLGDLVVEGGSGDDVIHGAINHHSSSLSGGAGDDSLIGGNGRTEFFGGSGADHIVMNNARDVASFVKSDSTPDHYDVIDNFTGISTGGRRFGIRLYFDSDDTTPGNQRSFHLGATPSHIGDIVAHYDEGLGHTIIDVFTNEDDVPDFVLHLTGDVALTIKDFYF